MITEEWKEEGKQAFREKKWNRYKRKLTKHLQSEGHPIEEITTAIEQLKLELGKELPEEAEDVNPFKAQDNLLGSYFRDTSTGSLRNLKYEKLFTSLDVEKIQAKQKLSTESELEKAKKAIDEFKDAEHPEKNKQIIIRNLELLEGVLDKAGMILEQRADLPQRKLRVDLGWIEEIGNLPIGKWQTRQRIYNYWETIHKDKYNAVKRRFKKFIEKSQPFVKGDSIDKDMKEAFEDVKELYRGEFTEDGSVVPNYVLKLQPFQMLIENPFSAAVSMIGLFLELGGIEQNVYASKRIDSPTGSDDETVGEDSVDMIMESKDDESAKPKYKEEATLTQTEDKIEDWDKEFVSKLKGTREKVALVDPIFWSKYNDNYEDISIPLSDLRKIREHLTGYYEGGGETDYMPLTSLIPKLQEGNRLENFNRWFDKWAKNMQLGRSEGPYFLPISEFIENEYYRDMNTTNTSVVEWKKGKDKKTFAEKIKESRSKKGGTVLWGKFNPFKGTGGEQDTKELTPETLDKTNQYTQRFLDVIVTLGKEINDAFDVYNEKITEVGGKGETSEAWGNLGAIKQISSQGIDRKIPEDLTGAWNSLMVALHEYYIEPISGKMFVKAKEKPRWATSNSWLNLSKMVKDKQGRIVSPIGSLLEKGMADITIEDIDALVDFMRIATRGTVLIDDNKLLEYGRDASEALDDIFGEQFSERNKISILNIVFESNPNATLSGAPKDMIRYFDIDTGDKSLKQYVKGEYNKSKNFPIDMLRHAINLPEFTAFYGISDYRAGAPKAEADIFGEGGDKTREQKRRLKAIDPEMHKALLKLDRFFDSFHKMDEINQSLLYAHDTIRKMENKPIVKSYLSLTDVDQMGLVIDKIHKEHRMDLTATEIDRIVKAVSSYESISRNYGINEEVVYTVKAMFR